MGKSFSFYLIFFFVLSLFGEDASTVGDGHIVCLPSGSHLSDYNFRVWFRVHNESNTGIGLQVCLGDSGSWSNVAGFVNGTSVVQWGGINGSGSRPLQATYLYKFRFNTGQGYAYTSSTWNITLDTEVAIPGGTTNGVSASGWIVIDVYFQGTYSDGVWYGVQASSQCANPTSDLTGIDGGDGSGNIDDPGSGGDGGTNGNNGSNGGTNGNNVVTITNTINVPYTNNVSGGGGTSTNVVTGGYWVSNIDYACGTISNFNTGTVSNVFDLGGHAASIPPLDITLDGTGFQDALTGFSDKIAMARTRKPNINQLSLPSVPSASTLYALNLGHPALGSVNLDISKYSTACSVFRTICLVGLGIWCWFLATRIIRSAIA
ncbi:MAG: hypothetical protein PHV34_20375 [Verrucomicrobiae bacterium]|nr:hypothetical protein [Verrucomicrobiae bacterium]